MTFLSVICLTCNLTLCAIRRVVVSYSIIISDIQTSVHGNNVKRVPNPLARLKQVKTGSEVTREAMHTGLETSSTYLSQFKSVMQHLRLKSPMGDLCVISRAYSIKLYDSIKLRVCNCSQIWTVIFHINWENSINYKE